VADNQAGQWDDNLNPIDEDASKKYQQRQKTLSNQQAYLVHRVFTQNEDGAKLLQMWRDSMEMIDLVSPGVSMAEMGSIDGYNRFVRIILRQIKQVEAGQK